MAFYRVKHLCREGYAVTDVIEAPNHRAAFHEARQRYDDVLSVRRAGSSMKGAVAVFLAVAAFLAALVYVFCVC